MLTLAAHMGVAFELINQRGGLRYGKRWGEGQ
jgi:hypothetical protein